MNDKCMKFSCRAEKGDFAGWTKVEFDLQSSERNTSSRLQLTTTKNGIIWFDQVSVMPSDTYMVTSFLCCYLLLSGIMAEMVCILPPYNHTATGVYEKHRTTVNLITQLVIICHLSCHISTTLKAQPSSFRPLLTMRSRPCAPSCVRNHHRIRYFLLNPPT
jgi:hypothetical protein